MKKLMLSLAMLMGMALCVRADSYTYSITVTNAQPITYSDALPVSGWLDKIEVTQDSTATSTVTVATYNSTTAVDTYYSKALESDGAEVARPRFIGTTSAGAALTAASSAVTACGTGSNIVSATVLAAAYERPMIGGNVKVAVTGTLNDGANTVKVTIFYEPLKK